jgi:hypothetical protein
MERGAEKKTGGRRRKGTAASKTLILKDLYLPPTPAEPTDPRLISSRALVWEKTDTLKTTIRDHVTHTILYARTVSSLSPSFSFASFSLVFLSPRFFHSLLRVLSVASRRFSSSSSSSSSPSTSPSSAAAAAASPPLAPPPDPFLPSRSSRASPLLEALRTF